MKNLMPNFFSEVSVNKKINIMDETKEKLDTLRNQLEEIKDNIQKIVSSETEKRISFDGEMRKYENIIPLLIKESKKKEFELDELKNKITTRTQVSISKPQEKEIRQLNQIEKILIERVSDANKNLKTAGKSSDQLLSMQSEVSSLKSDYSKLKKAYKEVEVTSDKSNEDIIENKNIDDSGNRSLETPESILKFRNLIEVANKVMTGYYEFCELTQAKNFYKEVLGIESEFKLNLKINETLIHDITRKLKNYEIEYKMKISDLQLEFIDLELKSQSIKSDGERIENDLYMETSKNKANSGEFVGGSDFFVSFSDVMSVLLCFFVVFFSISEQTAESFDKFYATWPFKNKDKEIKRPNNASLGDQDLKLIGKVKELVKSGASPNSITRNDTKTIDLILPNSVLFVPGKLKISSNGSIMLKEKIENILSKGGIRQIWVEGHTDDYDFSIHQKLIKKYSNNLAFSIAHASVVAQIINKKYKFPEKLIIITGFGAKQPFKLNPLDIDKKLNSRIEIKILQDKKIKTTQANKLEL